MLSQQFSKKKATERFGKAIGRLNIYTLATVQFNSLLLRN